MRESQTKEERPDMPCRGMLSSLPKIVDTADVIRERVPARHPEPGEDPDAP